MGGYVFAILLQGAETEMQLPRDRTVVATKFDLAKDLIGFPGAFGGTDAAGEESWPDRDIEWVLPLP